VTVAVALNPSRAGAQSLCTPASGAATIRGWQAYRRDSIPIARASFTLALRGCPTDNDAAVGLGYVALREGQLDEAERHFAAVAARDSANADAWDGLSMTANRKGDVAGAVRAAKHVVTLDVGKATAWQPGQTAETAVAFQDATEASRYPVRANILLARSLAWTNRIDSALVLLRHARTRVPDDEEVRYTEALYLSWAKHYDDAILRFDSLLARNSALDYVRVARARTLSWTGKFREAEAAYREVLAGTGKDREARRDAEVGLAQIVAWRGDYPAAVARYEQLLARDSTDPRALFGLANVRTWEGRPRAARSLLERAARRDTSDREVRTFLAAAKLAAEPRSDVEINWSDDSDGDQNAWALATHRVFVAEWLSATTSVGSLQARDALRTATRLLGEATLTATGDRMRISGTLGVRALDAATPGVPTRSTVTARGAATIRLPGAATLGLSVARVPFDEIAGLIARSIDLTAIDASLGFSPQRGLNVDLSGGTVAFSDGNRRTSGVLRVSQHWDDRPWIGLLGRSTRYADTRPGYFSPSQFSLYEVQGGWLREYAEWSGSIGAGLGTQQLDPSKPWQSAYHGEGRLARRWANGNTVALSAGINTNASASVVGAYRFRTAGLSATLVW
jgi:tetratricopeptide (TPR) repeat protein